MLLCDACGTGWHFDCLSPPLPGVPERETGSARAALKDVASSQQPRPHQQVWSAAALSLPRLSAKGIAFMHSMRGDWSRYPAQPGMGLTNGALCSIGAVNTSHMCSASSGRTAPPTTTRGAACAPYLPRKAHCHPLQQCVPRLCACG